MDWERKLISGKQMLERRPFPPAKNKGIFQGSVELDKTVTQIQNSHLHCIAYILSVIFSLMIIDWLGKFINVFMQDINAVKALLSKSKKSSSGKKHWIEIMVTTGWYGSGT